MSNVKQSKFSQRSNTADTDGFADLDTKFDFAQVNSLQKPTSESGTLNHRIGSTGVDVWSNPDLDTFSFLTGSEFINEAADVTDELFPIARPAPLGIVASAAADVSQTSGVSSSAAAASPAGWESEVTFLSGITSAAKVASISFGTWNYDSSATYSASKSYALKWGSPTLATSGSAGGNVTFWYDSASNWTTTEKNALSSGLALWSAEANISFSLASSANTANFTFYRGHDGSAYQSFPSLTLGTIGSGVDGTPASKGSSIHIDTSVGGFGPIGGAFSLYGGYPYETLIHEIGHELGLGHGGAYNGNVNSATQQFSAYDTRLWSLMSYINPWDANAKYYSSYSVTGTYWGISPDGYYYQPTTPMMMDTLAIQRMYGVATSGPLMGGQIFGFNCNVAASIKQYFDFTVNKHPVITIWDGGTHNTLDLSGFAANATISLAPGTFTSCNGEVNNIGIAMGTVIETAIGGVGNDKFVGSAGNHLYIGGAGTDTALYNADSSGFLLEKYGTTVAVLSGISGVHDRLQAIESIQFSDKTVSPSSATTFDAYEYIASYSDLIRTFGNNPQAGFDHYIDYGYAEGRALDQFDGWEYIASYSDLINAFGPNPAAGAQHYVTYGYNEGRAVNLFDGFEYLASNPDLITSVGGNAAAGAQHYVMYGHNDGRAVNLFDGLEYIASNPDLITCIGANAQAGAQHYVTYGYNESRATDLFNAEAYLANYSDLQAAFGDDPNAAALHYIVYGMNEGRTYQALPGAKFDAFVGNASANTMMVGSGDTVTGGAGADTFFFKAPPSTPATITDFTHGADSLQISAVDFGHGLAAGSAPTLLTAANATSASNAGPGGYFIFQNAGADAGSVWWASTGGSAADAVEMVHLQNVTTLLASDFHLI
jgi:hypothetical protein